MRKAALEPWEVWFDKGSKLLLEERYQEALPLIERA